MMPEKGIHHPVGWQWGEKEKEGKARAERKKGGKKGRREGGRQRRKEGKEGRKKGEKGERKEGGISAPRNSCNPLGFFSHSY